MDITMLITTVKLTNVTMFRVAINIQVTPWELRANVKSVGKEFTVKQIEHSSADHASMSLRRSVD